MKFSAYIFLVCHRYTQGYDHNLTFLTIKVSNSQVPCLLSASILYLAWLYVRNLRCFRNPCITFKYLMSLIQFLWFKKRQNKKKKRKINKNFVLHLSTLNYKIVVILYHATHDKRAFGFTFSL